jgi:hypothetical protein
MFRRFFNGTILAIITLLTILSFNDTAVAWPPVEVIHAFAFSGFRQDEVEANILEGCESFMWPSVILTVKRYAITDEQTIIDLAEVRVIAVGSDWSVPDTAYLYDITILTKPEYRETMYDWACEVTERSCLYVRGLPEWLEEAIEDIEPTIFFTRRRRCSAFGRLRVKHHQGRIQR